MVPELDKITIEAPAKINLYLEVLGERDDGYHDIRSVVSPLNLTDTITLERTDGPIELSMDCSDLDCSGINDKSDWLEPIPDSENIVYKATALLREKTGVSFGARIHIKKRIPIGGGLGGGSSDAASVLKGLNGLWGTELDISALMAIGSELGCDVPAFVHGGAVLMEGVGERITPVNISSNDGVSGGDWWLVVVNPGFPVLTGDIYTRYSPSLTSEANPFSSMVCAVEKGDLRLASDSLFNSLQETVFRKYPLIAMVAEGLKKAGATGVLLSGSGASVFGLAMDENDAHRVVGAVEEVLGFSVWSKVTKTCPMV